MSARPFAPVLLKLPGREPRRIASAFEAYECLTTVWPITANGSYRRAVRMCRDALDGFASPAKARRALLVAIADLDNMNAAPRMDGMALGNKMAEAKAALHDSQ